MQTSARKKDIIYCSRCGLQLIARYIPIKNIRTNGWFDTETGEELFTYEYKCPNYRNNIVDMLLMFFCKKSKTRHDVFTPYGNYSKKTIELIERDEQLTLQKKISTN